ncbi:MAG: HPF/RaiA family ribosome-associated protein [Polyangiaceae bacterium]
MMTIETRIHSYQSVDTGRWIERKFQASLDHLEDSISRMCVRVEPVGCLFSCRVRLWQHSGHSFVVRTKAESEYEAISAAARTLERTFRRSRERVRARHDAH